jgi:hypothetical protein
MMNISKPYFSSIAASTCAEISNRGFPMPSSTPLFSVTIDGAIEITEGVTTNRSAEEATYFQPS